MLQRSDAHVYLTYPFVASWSLREALSTGCVVIGSDTPTVSEFVTHEQNGLLVPFFDPKGLAQHGVAGAGGCDSSRVRCARTRGDTPRSTWRWTDYLAAYEALIGRLVGGATVQRTTAAAIEALSRPARMGRGRTAVGLPGWAWWVGSGPGCR